MPKAPAAAALKCDCGTPIDVAGRRIGDSVPCPSCRKLRVVLRSRVTGEVPPALGAPGTISDRLPEVEESLQRIRMRHAGHAARDVTLYPLGAVFGVGAFGFFLTAILQGQNLVALGFPERGRRLQVTGVLNYVLAAAVVLGSVVRYGFQFTLGQTWLVAFVLGALVAETAIYARAGAREVRAAFDAGARPASPILPALFGFLLAVAQLFVLKFVDVAQGW